MQSLVAAGCADLSRDSGGDRSCCGQQGCRRPQARGDRGDHRQFTPAERDRHGDTTDVRQHVPGFHDGRRARLAMCPCLSASRRDGAARHGGVAEGHPGIDNVEVHRLFADRRRERHARACSSGQFGHRSPCECSEPAIGRDLLAKAQQGGTEPVPCRPAAPPRPRSVAAAAGERSIAECRSSAPTPSGERVPGGRPAAMISNAAPITLRPPSCAGF